MTSVAILIAFFVLLLIFRSTIKVATSTLPATASDLLQSASKAARQLNNEVGTLAAEARVEQRQRLTVAAEQYQQLLQQDARPDAEILREMGF